MHRFKDRLAKGQLCRIFCVGRLMHPAVFDIHGMVGGYHGFWIDQEHVGITYEQVVLAASAGRANGVRLGVVAAGCPAAAGPRPP